MDGTDRTEAPASRLVTRRQCLKVMAGMPLAAVFGLSLSPLMRFLKPTMQPLNFLQAADAPRAVEPIQLTEHDLPHEWDCVPFAMAMRYVILGPKQEEIRQLPGYAIRVSGGAVVAYSRSCPRDRGMLFYLRDSSDNCGCAGKGQQCCCAEGIANPVLVCPRCHSTFDVANYGRVLAGPAWWPVRQFEVACSDGVYLVTAMQQYGIVG
jgi:Rieske Fe-S protein